MSDGWLGLIGALLGAVVGWFLTEVSRWWAERRRIQTVLGGAAFVCLDRLNKIQGAIESGNDEQREDETHLLGADLDKYRDCIGTAEQRPPDHLQAYERARRILLEHNYESLGDVMKEFKRVAT